MDKSGRDAKGENHLLKTLFLWGQSNISWKDVLIRWIILCGLSTAFALYLHFIGWEGLVGTVA